MVRNSDSILFPQQNQKSRLLNYFLTIVEKKQKQL